MEQTVEILLLEDDPSVRQVTKEILGCELWQVREAANAAEGIDLLAQYHASIRLIILDLVTPGLISGAELAEKFAHDYPKIPILLVSGRYLLRPNALGALVRRLVNLLGRMALRRTIWEGSRFPKTRGRVSSSSTIGKRGRGCEALLAM